MNYLRVILSSFLFLSIVSCFEDDDPGLEQFYENRDAGIAFLEENLLREEVEESPSGSGLQFEIIEEGDGDLISEIDIVKLKHKTSLIDGTVVYNSLDGANENLEYREVGALIPGMKEGLEMMHVGSKYKFYIPYELAYGESREFIAIDPYSVIIMEIEVVENSFINVTNSGLRYDILEEGTGEYVTIDDEVKVDYHGTFINSVVFDSSIDRGEPSEFFVKYVIDGWIEGLQLMNTGAKYKFFIPYDLAYGSYGSGNGVVPPYTSLIFEIELLEILD